MSEANPGGPWSGAGPAANDRGNPPAILAPPIVVWVIAGLAFIHIGRQLLSPDLDRWLVESLAFLPARFVVPMVASDGHAFLFGDVGAWLTFVTYTALHADFMHLIFNGFWLLAFGTAVVRRVGTARFLILYFIAGVCGALLHLVMNYGDGVLVIGASGAISGLMGAGARFMFIEARMAMLGIRLTAPPPLAPLTDSSVLGFVTIWMALNFLVGASGMPLMGEGQLIAWEAHLGGFLAGLFLIPFFDRDGRPPVY